MSLRLLAAALVLALLAAGIWAAGPWKGLAMNDTAVDPTEKDPRGLPIIFQRVVEEDIAGIDALLEAGASIEARGFQQSTPAIHGALGDIWPVVLHLLERGADPWAANRLGMTVPWLAATSRVGGDGPRAQALAAVRAWLNARGMAGVVFSPDEVKARLAEGKWPPAPE